MKQGKAHYSIYDKEDNQIDTLNLLATWQYEASNGLRLKDPYRIYDSILGILIIAENRISPMVVEELNERINLLKGLLYGQNNNSSIIRTRALDIGVTTMRILNKELDKKGILMRVKIDPSELGAV